jgi:hypothetical protein
VVLLCHAIPRQFHAHALGGDLETPGRDREETRPSTLGAEDFEAQTTLGTKFDAYTHLGVPIVLL